MSDASTSSHCTACAARPRLLAQVDEASRRRYYSHRTEEAYVHWIKRYIYFSGKRHPAEMGEAEGHMSAYRGGPFSRRVEWRFACAGYFL
jgi:hypothetical protein